MAYVNCQVASGDIGDWSTASGTFPSNMNDGSDVSYNYIVGSSAGDFTMFYDTTVIPSSGIVVTGVNVSGACSNNTSGGAQTWTCTLGGVPLVLGFFTADNTSYYFDMYRPGGGAWTKADLTGMFLTVNCDGNGNGNPMRVRSSIITVYFNYSVVLAPIGGLIPGLD